MKNSTIVSSCSTCTETVVFWSTRSKLSGGMKSAARLFEPVRRRSPLHTGVSRRLTGSHPVFIAERNSTLPCSETTLAITWVQASLWARAGEALAVHTTSSRLAATAGPSRTDRRVHLIGIPASPSPSSSMTAELTKIHNSPGSSFPQVESGLAETDGIDMFFGLRGGIRPVARHSISRQLTDGLRIHCASSLGCSVPATS